MTSKGITPVIATVLLITVTVAATVSAFTFMTGIQNDIKENTENQISKDQREQRSDLNLETAYNSSDGYIITNIRNSGSIVIEVEDDNQKLWNLYDDGRPIGGDGTGWIYRDSSKRGSNVERVIVQPQSVISINTTVKYPAEGSDKIIKVSGPYKTSDSLVCYNSGAASC